MSTFKAADLPSAVDESRTLDIRPVLRVVFPEDGPPAYAPSVLPIPGGNRSRLYLISRRLLDIAGALAGLILFAPLLLLVWACLMVTTRGRAFFVQERIGECGRPFRMYKFRTMQLDAEEVQHLVKNERSGPVFKNRTDPRITMFGRILRSFSIDEMPQLVNVLMGDMSLVGPRPPLTKEAQCYTPQQWTRLAVRPGLTCLWQVSGRAELDFDDQVQLDRWYVQNQSLRTDLRLLARTPLSVISRRGAY